MNGRTSWQPESKSPSTGKNTPFILKKTPTSFTELVDAQSPIPNDYILLEKSQSNGSPSTDRFGFTIGSRNSSRYFYSKEEF